MNANNVAIPPPPQQSFGGVDRGRTNSVHGRLRAASEMQRQGIITKEEKAALKQRLLESGDLSFRDQFDQARSTGDLSAIKKLLANSPLLPDMMLADMTDMTLGDVDEFSSFLDGLDGGQGGFFGNAPPGHLQQQQQQQQQHGQHPHPQHIAQPPPQQQQQQQQQHGGTGRMATPPQVPLQTHHRQSVGFSSEFGGRMGGPEGGSGPMAKTVQQAAAEAAGNFTRKRQASKSMPAQGMHKVMAQGTAMGAVGDARNGGPGAARIHGRPMGVHASQFSGNAVHSQQRSSHHGGHGASHPQQQGGGQGRPGHPGVKMEGGRGGGSGGGGGGGGYGIGADSGAAGVSPHMMRDIGAMESMGRQMSMADDDGDRSGLAKSRKNERERKRRLAVTQGFDELYKLLKRLEEESSLQPGNKDAKSPNSISAIATSKLDKASILKSSIEKIQLLEGQIQMLRKENDRLNGLISSGPK